VKAIFIALLILVISAFSLAEGVKETAEEPDNLTLVIGTPDITLAGFDRLYGEYIGPEFTRRTGIPVEIIDKGSATGNTEKLDLLLASGDPVDVYADYMGRLSKYSNPDYAVDLTQVLPESFFDRFYPTLLAQYRVSDAIYALPDSAWATAFVINTTLADRVGMSYLYERENLSWTMDEFDAFARAVADLGDEFFGSAFFAKQSTGDYYLQTFIAGFGATIFDLEGNIVADSPEMIQAFEYILSLQRDNVIVPGGAGIDDSEYKRRWSTGKIGAATGFYFFPGMTDGSWQSTMIAPPRAAGVTGPTVIMGNDGALVFKSKTGRKRAAELAAFLVSNDIQQFRCEAQYRFASVPGVTGKDDALYHAIAGIIDRNGILNAGLTYSFYNRVREAWYPMVQAILSEILSPAEAMTRFAEEARGYASK